MADEQRELELSSRAFATRGSLLRDPAFTYRLTTAKASLGRECLTLGTLFFLCPSDFSGWRTPLTGFVTITLEAPHA